MDTLFEDVASVMSVMDLYGARDLVNANRVFEELEACHKENDRVNHVATILLSNLGINTRESASPDVIIVPSENESRPIDCTETLVKNSGGYDSHHGSESDSNKEVVVTASVIEVVPKSSNKTKSYSQLDIISPTFAKKFDKEIVDLSPLVDRDKEHEDSASSRNQQASSLPSKSQTNWNKSVPKSIMKPFQAITVKSSSPDLSPVKVLPHQIYTSPTDISVASISMETAENVFSPSKRNLIQSSVSCKRVKLNDNDKNSTIDNGAGMPSNPMDILPDRAARFVGALFDMFPEADPQYLWQKCENIKNEAELNEQITSMITSNDYPRINLWKCAKDAAPGGVRQVSAAAGSEKDLPFVTVPGVSRNDTNQELKAPSSEVSSSDSGASTGPTRLISSKRSPEKGEAKVLLQSKSTCSVVPEKIVKNENNSSVGLVKVNSLSELRQKMKSSSDNATPDPSQIDNPSAPREPWQDKLEFFLQILPDLDPSFLEEKACNLYDKDEESQQFVLTALESKDLPSRKDWQWRQDQLALQKKYTEEFSIEGFLEMFPDPFTFFGEGKRQCDKSMGTMFLRNKYKKLRAADISATFSSNNFNLTSTCRQLDKWDGPVLKNRRCHYQVGYDVKKSGEKGIDLQFLQEVAFIENESKIIDHLNSKKAKRETAFNEAKEKGELLECQCCYDSEVLFDDIRACEEGHIFCLECVKRSSEQRIGEGKTSFPCLADCTAEFKLKTIQEVLKPVAFSRLVQRKQAEEVKAAGIDDLVQCPFCDFCNLLVPEDKVFKCLNPDCLKRSCRQCKEEDHVPLRCEEVEKSSEIKMRTYIEDQMTAALVRTCWKCSRKFVKEDGCNKMTCQCGAMMCYICRQPVKDYSHFNGQGGDAFDKCLLYSDHRALEAEEVKKVAEKAKQQAQAMKPNVQLKHDPTKILPVYTPPAQKNPQNQDFYDTDSDEYYSSDEDEERFFHWNRRYARHLDELEEEEDDVEEEGEEDMEEEGGDTDEESEC